MLNSPAVLKFPLTSPQLAGRKQECRRQLLELRRQFSLETGLCLSHKINQLITCLPEFRNATAVAAYAATPGEVDLLECSQVALDSGKLLLFPRFNAVAKGYDMVPIQTLAGGLRPGRFGIREPASEIPAYDSGKMAGAKIIWLVPGVGFDRAGRRLGRGKGYYDRLLTGVSGVKIGVAFSWQIWPVLPAATNDVMMDIIVSESGIMRSSLAATKTQNNPGQSVP